MSGDKDKFFINKNRIKYLLDQYKLSDESFLDLFNDGRKKIISIEDFRKINNGLTGVDINYLKRIEKIFGCGLTWVVVKDNAPDRKRKSVFFRKEKFNTYLDFYSKKVVSGYEDLKFNIEALSKYVDFNLKDKIEKKYTTKDNPSVVAEVINNDFDILRRKLLANKTIKNGNDEKTYLVNLIRMLGELNIFVFEHLEAPVRKEKVSFDGFFISPNIIVVKRQQKYLRREIFTLIHEFAHYLLNMEEVDDDDDDKIFRIESDVEQWCHSFAFYFLLGNEKKLFNDLNIANNSNNFNKTEIEKIYSKTKLSFKAIYTNLLINNKISKDAYKMIIDDINKAIREGEVRKKMKQDEQKDLGATVFGVPKPIVSNIFKELVVSNFFEGNINEPELRSFLKISQKHSIEDVIYS